MWLAAPSHFKELIESAEAGSGKKTGWGRGSMSSSIGDACPWECRVLLNKEGGAREG